MKKQLSLFALIITVILISSCAVKNADNIIPTDIQSEENTRESAETVKKKEDATPNWSRIIQENKICIGTDGSKFDKKLAEALSKEMGIQTEFLEYKSFDDAADAIKDKKIDMYIGGFPKEATRSIEFCMSEPYLKSTFLVISKNEDYKVNKKEDVAGVLKNCPEAHAVESYFGNYKIYSSLQTLFSALNSKEVDCALIDEITYEKSGYKSDYHYVCDSYVYNVVAVFDEHHSDVCSKMNVYLAKIKASGIAGEISEEVFGKDIVCK